MVILGVSTLIILTVGLVLPIWGFLIRFSYAGKLCSGDYYEKDDHPKPYLWATGDWIYTVVILHLSLLFTACCCFIAINVRSPETGRYRPMEGQNNL